MTSVPTETGLRVTVTFIVPVGIVELVGVDEPLTRDEPQVLAAERVAVAGGEVAERHAVPAADLGVELVHGAGEAIRRQPTRDGIGFQKALIDLLRRRRQTRCRRTVLGMTVLFSLVQSPLLASSRARLALAWEIAGRNISLFLRAGDAAVDRIAMRVAAETLDRRTAALVLGTDTLAKLRKCIGKFADEYLQRFRPSGRGVAGGRALRNGRVRWRRILSPARDGLEVPVSNSFHSKAGRLAILRIGGGRVTPE